MRLAALLILLAPLGALADAPDQPPAVAPAEQFLVFDCLGFRDKPNLTRLGLQRIWCTGQIMYRRLSDNPPVFDRTRGDERSVRWIARRAAREQVLLCLDIEHWPVDLRKATKEQVDEGQSKLLEIINWIKDERPDVQVGYYSLMPNRDFFAPVRPHTRRGTPQEADAIEGYQRWKEANDYYHTPRQPDPAYPPRSLVEAVDVVFPSIYLFYDNVEQNIIYVRENLREARRYGKPVYPFIMFTYHPSNKQLADQLIPMEILRPVIEVAREEADGIVLWSSARSGAYSREIHARVEMVLEIARSQP